MVAQALSKSLSVISEGKIKEGSALIGAILHEVSDNFNKTTNENWEQALIFYFSFWGI